MYYKLLENEIKLGKKTKSLKDDNWNIYWEGIVFIKGFKPGEESFSKFLELIKELPLNEAIKTLSGIFGCFLEDIKNNKICIFTDNSGIFNLFKSPNYSSSSFFDIIELENKKKSNIIPERLTDIVAANGFMKGQTYFEDINKIKYNDLIIDDGKEIKFEKKDLEDLFKLKSVEGSIIDQYGAIAESLKKLEDRISLDLTGGLDTRMNATVLKYHGLDFETAISGVPGNQDVEISKLVAEELGTEHYISYHKVDSNLNKNLEHSFNAFEALQDIVIWERYYQFQKDKMERNCLITLTGHAGELYKAEFIWNLNNENPKYAINQMLDWGANIRYGTAIRSIPHEIYTKKYQTYSKNYENRVRIYLLENFGDDDSGKAGAKIYAYFNEASRCANMGPLVDRYTPLLDRDLIPYGVTLKTTTRTFKGKIKRLLTQPWDDRDVFESRVITSINPKVAKIPITSSLGFNASTKRVDRMKKLYLIIKNKVRKNDFKFISPIHEDFYPTIRTLSKTEDLMELLKTEEILNKKAEVNQIGNYYLGTLITIGMFLDFMMEGNK